MWVLIDSGPQCGRCRGGPGAGGGDEEEAHDQAGGAGEVHVDQLLQRE